MSPRWLPTFPCHPNCACWLSHQEVESVSLEFPLASSLALTNRSDGSDTMPALGLSHKRIKSLTLWAHILGTQQPCCKEVQATLLEVQKPWRWRPKGTNRPHGKEQRPPADVSTQTTAMWETGLPGPASPGLLPAECSCRIDPRQHYVGPKNHPVNPQT